MTLDQRSVTFDFSGQVAWITGASRGLGEATAMAFSDAGAAVVLMARSKEDLDRIAETVRSNGREVLTIVGSVNEDDDIRRAAREIDDHFGRLDVLVNNAGISPTLKRSAELEADVWRQIVDVNLTGAFLASQAAWPLLTQSGGSIINVSSVHGSVGFARMVTYSASKGGMELMTKSLALEWADQGVRVNAVAPGYIETSMTEGLRGSDRWSQILLDRVPMDRFGEVDEIVPSILFLASSAARYITGATLSVDGGWTAQ